MSEDLPTSKNFIRAHCNNCACERNHGLLHSEKCEGSEELDENYTIDWWDIYEMLRCRGCESIIMRKTTYFSEAFEKINVTYFPPAISRREPHWLHMMENPTEFDCHPITELLKEIYVALHNDSRRLAAMGIRALLDCVFSEKVDGDGTFAECLSEKMLNRLSLL